MSLIAMHVISDTLLDKERHAKVWMSTVLLRIFCTTQFVEATCVRIIIHDLFISWCALWGRFTFFRWFSRRTTETCRPPLRVAAPADSPRRTGWRNSWTWRMQADKTVRQFKWRPKAMGLQRFNVNFIYACLNFPKTIFHTKTNSRLSV